MLINALRLHSTKHRPQTRLAAASGPDRSDGARRRGEQGFTLVEMLVVLAIISLIMAMVGPRVLGYLGTSKVQAARIQIGNFASALDLYYLDNGGYPNASQGLAGLMQKPAGVASWNGPYLKGADVPKDPWGRDYVYAVPGQHGAYDIVSRGADGHEEAEGSAINSWQH
jgi:general secretion pathway protein G